MLDILGTGPEYIWEEVEKISDISSEDTAEALVYNLPNMTEDSHYMVKGWKFDWTKLYGTLKEGEYEFILKAEMFWIRIKFTIDSNGLVNYDEPSLGF